MDELLGGRRAHSAAYATSEKNEGCHGDIVSKMEPKKQVFGPREERKLGKVFVDEFCHFKHIDCFFAAKDLSKLLIRIDVALVFWILKIVLLDVSPKLFGHFCAGHWSIAHYSSKFFAGFHRLHEFRIFLLRCHVFHSPLKRLDFVNLELYPQKKSFISMGVL